LIHHKIKPIKYEFTDQLSRYTYVKVIRRILACIRHAAYPRFKEAIISRTMNANEASKILVEIGDDH